jgi:DNA-binding transcriptional ArsR family regulator
VKQITEIDDPRLVKALAHPLRINILRVLQDRVASPSEIAAEISAPLGNVSYHVRFLQRVGLLELVSTRPRRGAVEHYYRAIGRLLITDKAWAQVPEIIKNAMVSATLDQAVRYIGAAASAGGFDRSDAHVSRTPMILDQRGFAELAKAVGELHRRASEIEAASAQRIAASDHQNGEINAGLVMLLFEAPPAHTGLAPHDGNAPPRATRSKRRAGPDPNS